MITGMSPEILNHILPTTAQNPESGVPLENHPTPPSFVCDLAKGNAFYPGLNEPPVPVLAAFDANCLHQCKLEGSLDFEQTAADNPGSVIRSYRLLKRNRKGVRWEDVIFQFGQRAFLCGDQRRNVGYASSHQEAEKIVRDFTLSYGQDFHKSGGSFQIIRKNRYGIECENVILDADTVLGETTFYLHDPSQAARLAASMGKILPHARDYSLAEVFAGHQSEDQHRPHIGFGGK